MIKKDIAVTRKNHFARRLGRDLCWLFEADLYLLFEAVRFRRARRFDFERDLPPDSSSSTSILLRADSCDLDDDLEDDFAEDAELLF